MSSFVTPPPSPTHTRVSPDTKIVFLVVDAAIAA